MYDSAPRTGAEPFLLKYFIIKNGFHLTKFPGNNFIENWTWNCSSFILKWIKNNTTNNQDIDMNLFLNSYREDMLMGQLLKLQLTQAASSQLHKLLILQCQVHTVLSSKSI